MAAAMFRIAGLVLAALFLSSPILAEQVPTGGTIAIHVVNDCEWTKEFAIYGVNSDFQMEQYTPSVNIDQGDEYSFDIGFYDQGLRLSGHAEWGVDGQWQAQALFEFSYSSYDGVSGTAYDLSLMSGSDWNIGMSVQPIDNGQGSGTCASKYCAFPSDCPIDQGWTNPDQVNDGSPANTVCYKGMSDYRVVFCPP